MDKITNDMYQHIGEFIVMVSVVFGVFKLNDINRTMGKFYALLDGMKESLKDIREDHRRINTRIASLEKDSVLIKAQINHDKD